MGGGCQWGVKYALQYGVPYKSLTRSTFSVSMWVPFEEGEKPKEEHMYEYEHQRAMLNMHHQSPEQQQPFHQRISEPADPFCRRTCSVHVEPLQIPDPIVFPMERPSRMDTFVTLVCARHGFRNCFICL